MNKHTCENCKFCAIKRWPRHHHGKGDAFTCHRYPPAKVRGFTFGARFEVDKTEWCGEWVAQTQVE